MSGRPLPALVCALLMLLGAGSTAARADVFGPIEIASASAPASGPHEQANDAIHPAISGDGRYVAFAGSFGGQTGVWRRDLLTGQVEQVAPGNATLPSISADGRYVSFTTNESLVPEDTNASPDVYVRDMEPGPGEPAYELASAVNGTDEGAHYASEHPSEFGSLASARSAISANGRYVVFITTAQSNLLGEAEATPALEVLVRDRATGETKLVSAEYNPATGQPADGVDKPVQPQINDGGQYGAVFPGGANTPRFAPLVPDPANPEGGQAEWVGASISADGTTVTWMGQDLGEQTQLLPGEQGTEEAQLAEPLWRRIGEGAAAPTRRVTGGSDPADPLCHEQELTLPLSPLDPCAGPFEHYEQNPEGLWGTKVDADYVPQLSADGTTVAFLTGAREVAGGVVQFAEAESTDDLYVVNMADGLTRVQALRRLTAIGGGGGTEEKIEKSSAIRDFAVSPDGTQVAFTTQRTQYPLGSPALVSAPAATPGMIELFDVDLADDTITRVTHGFESEDERSEQQPTPESPGVDPYHDEQGAYSPSFSDDGDTLSFASTANNLVYGDGNDESDAFIVHRIPATPGTVAQYVSSPPASPALVPPWELRATAVSLPDGRVMLDVEVPGAGSVSAGASSSIRIRTKRAGNASGRAGARRASVTVATRDVASGRVAAGTGSDGLVQLALTLLPAYRSLAAGGGLDADVRITFSATGHAVLHFSLPVKFLRTEKAKPKPRSRAARRHPGRRR